jgi:hypothetical protein
MVIQLNHVSSFVDNKWMDEEKKNVFFFPLLQCNSFLIGNCKWKLSKIPSYNNNNFKKKTTFFYDA